MTRRDLTWRAGGFALFVAASAVGLVEHSPTDAPDSTFGLLLGLIGFLLAIAGIVLLVQGKRVPQSWRAERRRHRARPLSKADPLGSGPGTPGELSL